MSHDESVLAASVQGSAEKRQDDAAGQQTGRSSVRAVADLEMIE
jgi:hypothetical protein